MRHISLMLIISGGPIIVRHHADRSVDARDHRDPGARPTRRVRRRSARAVALSDPPVSIRLIATLHLRRETACDAQELPPALTRSMHPGYASRLRSPCYGNQGLDPFFLGPTVTLGCRKRPAAEKVQPLRQRSLLCAADQRSSDAASSRGFCFRHGIAPVRREACPTALNLGGRFPQCRSQHRPLHPLPVSRP